MFEPTPEELAIIQKHCKHLTITVDKDVEFLKEGEEQPAHCSNCDLVMTLKINWDKYLKDSSGEFLYCEMCGCRIVRGKEYQDTKKPDNDWFHESCYWGPDDDNW